jgi:hypothetical protein
MFGPTEKNNPVLGAINSTYSARQCVGALASGWFIDRYGRRAGMKIPTIIAFVGAAVTTGAVDSGMLIAGRTFTGLATGALLSIMPAYISEISRREQRALLVGDYGHVGCCRLYACKLDRVYRRIREGARPVEDSPCNTASRDCSSICSA